MIFILSLIIKHLIWLGLLIARINHILNEQIYCYPESIIY